MELAIHDPSHCPLHGSPQIPTNVQECDIIEKSLSLQRKPLEYNQVPNFSNGSNICGL